VVLTELDMDGEDRALVDVADEEVESELSEMEEE